MKPTDLIGWVATGLFLASYGCKDQKKLRIVQAGAALVWAAYGALIGAVPIIVANLLLAAVAVYSSLARGGSDPRGRHPVTASPELDIG
jgi:Bacterial inner membrane protein